MDEQWVERLVEENRSALLAYLRRHVSGREDAEDLLQEVFLSCYRHRESFDPARCSEKALAVCHRQKPSAAVLPGHKTDRQSG